MVFAPALQHDPESTTWAYFKSYQWTYDRFNGEGAPPLKEQEKQSAKVPIERLNGIIDTEDPRFDKLKEESFASWEQTNEQLCESMNTATEVYYERQNSVFEQIQQTIVDKREVFAPECDELEQNDEFQALSNQPWLFQNLPGIGSIKNAESLRALNTRLAEMQPASFWNEPIEIMNGGPEFLTRVKQTLLTKVVTYDKETSSLLGECLSALMGVATLSGNLDLILEALTVFTQFQQVHEQQADSCFLRVEAQLQNMLAQIKAQVDQAPYEHALFRNNISRVFGIASMYPIQGLNERNSSLTSDGTYLYLAIGMTKRANLYKIGSGENNTIPGKVYLQSALEREGDLTWAFCQDKLYMRYQQGELFCLHIFDPLTLQKTGEAKLFMADIPAVSQGEYLNRNFPLLVDPQDGALCIITAEVEKRTREVLPECTEDFAVCASLKAAAFKPSEKDQKEAETEEELKKLPKAEQIKRQKEKIRKGKGDGSAPPVDDKLLNYTDFSSYAVLAFKLHKFDVSGKLKVLQQVQDEPKSDHELLKDPLVLEMHQTFSGFFKIADCARALKYNKQDIETAATWLVAEKEKPDSLVFKRVKSTLLSESLLVNGKEPEKSDYLVKPSSLLNHTAITAGRWTMNLDQISYHLNGHPDNSQVIIFKLDNQPKPSPTTMAENSWPKFDLTYGMSQNLPATCYKIDNTWRLLSLKQLLAKIEEGKKNNKLIDIECTEESLFEPVALYNNHYKTLTKMRAIDHLYANQITYCAVSKRWFCLNIGSQQRLVLSAQDLQLQSPNDSVVIKSSRTVQDFVGQALELIAYTEKLRFRQPWRWNKWHHTYQSQQSLSQRALTVMGQHLFGPIENPMQEPDQDKTKAAAKRLKKRLALSLEHQLLQILGSLGINNNLSQDKIAQFKQKYEKKQNSQKSQELPKNLAGIVMKPGSSGDLFYCGRNLGRALIPGSDGQCGPNNGPQCADCKAVPIHSQIANWSKAPTLNQFKQFSTEELTLPIEKICVPIELFKVYQYCLTGSLQSLRFLLDLQKSMEHQSSVFELLLQWTTHASWLCSQGPEVSELYKLCIDLIERQDVSQSYAQRILIVGWQYFATDAQKQIEMLGCLLKSSPKDTVAEQPPVELLLDAKTNASATLLLKARFCGHASFYDLEILNQRIVTNNVIVLKGIQLQNQSGATETNSVNFSFLQPKFFKLDQPTPKILTSFTASNLQLKDVPIQFIFLKRVMQKQTQSNLSSYGFGHSNNQGSGINASYFNVPLACCFSKELIHGHFESKSLDLQFAASIYKQVDFSQLSQAEKASQFKQIRADYTKMQLELMSICKQRIIQGCQSTLSVFTLFLGQALDWIEFDVPSLPSLLVEAIEICNLVPYPPLISLVILTVNRCYDSGMHMAVSLLPQLLQLIQTMQKQGIKADDTQVEGVDESNYRVFETSHPYPRSDQRYQRTIKIAGAVGYLVEFDRRCSVESGNDVLKINSFEYNQQITDKVGTEFRFDRAPLPGQSYIVYGSHVDIEFTSRNPRGRSVARGRGGPGMGRGGRDLAPREDNKSRWGYKLTIKPIHITPKQLEGNPQTASILNNLIQVSVRLACGLTNANFVTSKEQEQQPEAKKAIETTMNWHLFKGGLKIPDLQEQTDVEVIMKRGLVEVNRIHQECLDSQMQNLEDPLEETKELPMQIDTTRPASFLSEKSVWAPEVKTLLGSQLIKDVITKMRTREAYPYGIKLQKMKKSFVQHWDKWAAVEELIVVAMLYHSESIADAYKFAELSSEQLSAVQDREDETSYIIEEFSMIAKLINTVLTWMLARLNGQSEFQFLLEDSVKVAQQIIQNRYLLQVRQEHEAKQRQELDSKKDAPKTSTKAVITKVKSQFGNRKRANIIKITKDIQKPKKAVVASKDIEESKEPEMPEFLSVDLVETKAKILSELYQLFIDTYQVDNDLTKLLNLCMYFDIDLNANDISSTLQDLFRRVKLRIRPIIDLDAEEIKLPCRLDLKELNLGSAAEEVAQDVSNRMLLLFETKPSVNYLAEVTRINQKRPKMSVIAEQEEEIQSQFSGQKQGMEFESDLSDFEDDLLPIQASRSMSLPNTVLSGMNKLGAGVTTGARTRTRKQSAEYAMFIDSYRKWRLWSKRNQAEEEDLLSPQGSPLLGVVSFAKMSKISDVEMIRSYMKDHVYRAAFRLSGLQYQERLFTLLKDTPYTKYLWGTKGLSLHRSVLHNIETCGEQITRHLNAVTRQIVQQLMKHFVEHIQSLVQRLGTMRRQRKDVTSTAQSVNGMDHKRLLLTLNDIRVLLSNSYTKEYVLESLRADKHISTKNSLGVDQIKLFLKAVVSILVKMQNFQSHLSGAICQVAKLVLRLFIRQSETVKSETQRILQEMLLDIIVQQFEQARGQSAESPSRNSVSMTHHNSVAAILKMLSEVLRISSAQQESILQPGSAKVTVCANLLASLITSNSETPAVVRQAIKCAKLLNKHLGSNFSRDIIKSIGRKIRLIEQKKTTAKHLGPEHKGRQGTRLADVPASQFDNDSDEVKDNGYQVVIHCNIPQEEDFCFLVTALYHMELAHPQYAQKLHKNVSEIVKKVKPPKDIPVTNAVSEGLPPIQQAQPLSQVQLKDVLSADILQPPVQPQLEEVKVVESEQDKDWQTDSPHSDEERLFEKIDAPREGHPGQDFIFEEHRRIVEQMTSMMEQLGTEMEGDEPMRESQFNYLKQRHQELGSIIGAQGDRSLTQNLEEAIQKIHQNAKKAFTKPAAPSKDQKPPVQYPTSLKIQHIMNALEEAKKVWSPPLSTDSLQVQEQKLKERNFQITASKIVEEAVNIAAQMYTRNSMPIARILTSDQASDFCSILIKAYAGQLDPLPMNPFTSEADAAKVMNCVKLPLKDLFPVVPKNIKDLGPKEQNKLASLLEKIQVAPKRFNVSILNKSHCASLEKEMTSKLTEIKSSQRSQRMGPIVHSFTKKMQFGHSISNVISELVQFVRCLPSDQLQAILNQSLKQYLENPVSHNILYGIVAVLGGWDSQIATGAVVDVKQNELWYRGVVVDAGQGKKYVTVILNDDTLTLLKVKPSDVKTFTEPLEIQPDISLLLQVVIKAQDDKLLLCLLLRACAQMKLQLEQNEASYEPFVQLLVQVSQAGNIFDEDKSQQQWENQLMLSWERLIHPQSKTANYEQQGTQSVQLNAGLQGIQNNDYVQPLNSFLQGLPEVATLSVKSESRLKLLHYWEKNVIPSILAFCQGHYKQWEFEYYFEQLRFYLRKGEAANAISDAMKMLENKLPNGLIIPDETQDWSAKIIEECIVGNWLLSKIKHRGSQENSLHASQFSMVLTKLQSLGIEEILVQIKSIDARTNAVLAEYIDYDTMLSHYVWIPITNLQSLQSPITCSQQTSSQEEFNFNLQKVAAIYSRKTLQQFVATKQQMPVESLNFEQLVQWTVWEEFGEDVVTGWMHDLPSLIELQPKAQRQTQSNKTLGSLLDQSIEQFAHETYIDQKSTQAVNNTLTSIKSMLSQGDRHQKMVDWCSTLWFSMAFQVAANRCVVDIVSEHDKLTTMLSLHELLPNRGDQSIGTLLMFKRHGVQLSPCSKVQFYSDPQMVNLIHEVFAGNDVITELPPVVLKHSRVWVHHHVGTNALLFKDDQKLLQAGKSSLETAIVSIPKEWQVVCWLTETLTTIQLQKPTSQSIQVCHQLIQAMLAFYEDSKAPLILKSVVLKLLTRIIIKLRHLNQQDSSHFDNTKITKDFLQGLLSEMMVQMESSNSLHGAFVQDAVEFFMSFVIPTQKTQLKSYQDVLQGIQIPEWLAPSLKLSFYLHFFRGDLDHLPLDMVKPQTQTDFANNFIVLPLQDMPSEFTTSWLVEQVTSLIAKHQAQVLDLSTDIVVLREHLIILIDGWHPLKPIETAQIEDSDQEITPKVVVAEVQIPKLQIYQCVACTLENPISASRCGICESPRPPMQQLEEEWRQQHAPTTTEPSEVVAKVSLDEERLKALATELKTIVSKVQKLKVQVQVAPVEEVKVEEVEREKESDSDIDLDNLPQNVEERFSILGIDPSILQLGERDIIQVMEMSAIDEIRARQDKKKEAKMMRRKTEEEARKLKQKEEQKRLMDQGHITLFKFKVKAGVQAFEDQVVSQILQEFLRNRVCEFGAGDQLQFNPRTKDIINAIHAVWQENAELDLPTDELLSDLEITPETMRSIDAESMQEMLLNLALADAALLMKLLYSQGYDLWLTQSYITGKPTAKQMSQIKNVSLLERLKRLVEQDMCQESKLVEYLDPSKLRILSVLPQMKRSVGYYDESQVSHIYPELCEQVSQPVIRHMWAILKNFNEYYAPVVPFINQQECASQHTSDKSVLPMRIASYISQTRDLCFNCVKTDLRHLILEKTTVPREQPQKLYFERLRLADQFAQDGGAEQQFMFQMAHDQVKDMDFGLLRPKKPLGAEPHIAFEIVFRNEHVVGEGGPYRQFFADVSKELQPSRLERGTQQKLLELLAPCANQREAEKVGKDKFVINSTALGQKQLSQFEFLGVLMGVCIRTGAHLILDLPQFFWKQLVGQKTTLDDLYEIEVKLTENLKGLLAMTSDEFSQNERFWTTTLSDGSVIDLRPNGATTPVLYEDVEQYVRQTLEHRLRESQPQFKSIKRGISKIIPCSLFNIVTSKELEIWVCGRNTVDVDLLMRHTSYSGSYTSEHPVILMFWQTLNAFREEEKQKFIKFCWGQERIPANDQDFKSQNVRFMIKQPQVKANQSMDQMLPKADTCFFNFELPTYSCPEVMRSKIMQAITFDCVSMNAEEQQVGGEERHDPRNLFDDDY